VEATAARSQQQFLAHLECEQYQWLSAAV
jgi:hypothetical protein